MRRVGMVVAAVVASTAASAGEVDFTQPILDLAGQAVMASGAKDAKPLMLLDVATMGLLNVSPGGAGDSLETKSKKFALALEIFSKKKLTLRAEDVVLVKNAIAGVYGPLVVGRAVQLLEGVEAPK